MLRASRHALLAAIACAALLAPLAATAQRRAARDLEGYWANSFLTTLERPPGLTSLVVSEDQARAFQAAQSGKPVLPNDVVGQDDSEWWDLGAALARIDGRPRSSWIVEPADGLLPYSAAGAARLKAAAASYAGNFDNPEARPPSERCLLGGGSKMGPPMLNSNYSNLYQIVQTADYIVIHTEAVHDVRIIRLGDRRHLPRQVRPWMGDSIGWWEGSTLVVETTNLNPGDILRNSSRLFLSPDAKVTERFTRVSAKQLRYDFTVDDPAMFTRPWRAETVLETTAARPLSYDCHEGNYSLPNILAGARQSEGRQSAGASR